jgi:hypothetical protein
MLQQALWSFSLHHTPRWAKDLVTHVWGNAELNIRVMSFPKAGRTWTTNLWYFYVLALTRQDRYFGKDKSFQHSILRPAANPGFIDNVLPLLKEKRLARLTFSHGVRPGDRSETVAKWVERKIGHHNYAVIVRRPSRILPSYYHHIKSRLRYYPEGATLSCVSDIVRSELYGIDRIIDYYSVFDNRCLGRRFVVYYEDLLVDTRKVFRSLLLHAGYRQISEAALDYAIEQSSFDRMQAAQRAKRLAAGMSNNPNLLRYRVGGDGKGELTAEDEDFVAERLRQANISLLDRYLK